MDTIVASDVDDDADDDVVVVLWKECMIALEPVIISELPMEEKNRLLLGRAVEVSRRVGVDVSLAGRSLDTLLLG